MSGIDTAKAAVDANFEINGISAKYHSVWPSDGADCLVLPDEPDATLGLDVVKVTQRSALFAVRKSQAAPVQGGFLVVNDVRHRIEEAPQLDAFRLVYRCRCVRA